MQVKSIIYVAVLVVGQLVSSTTEAADGAEFDLRPRLSAGQCARVTANLEVEGKLHLAGQEQTEEVPLKASGALEYDEQLLAVPDAPLANCRSARWFHKAEAAFHVKSQQSTIQLDDRRRLIVVDWAANAAAGVAVEGRLTRDELDLIEPPGNSLLVDGLLPQQPVKVEESWTHAPELLAALLGIDAVTSAEVHSVLREADASAARCELAGNLFGAVGGVSTEIEIKAKYKFEFGPRRITWLAMLVHEKRSISPVTPGIDAVSRLQLQIKPMSSSAQLVKRKALLSRDPLTPADLQLSYESPTGQYRLNYDRRWHVISEQPNMLVLRLLDRGGMLAQCNVSTKTLGKQDAAPALTGFQEEIKKALGNSFGQFVRAGQHGDDPKRQVLWVVAQGQADELPIEWHYFLVANTTGQQVVLAFTLQPDEVEALNKADVALVRGLEFLPPATDTAATPTELRAR
ncbi:MAG: hypothetical protein K2Y37_08545 [Pirellulales bacterium]|nr:hypothetical protein [Pirellulales bacterium]